MAVLLSNFTLSGAKEQGAPVAGGGNGVIPPKGVYEVRISDSKAHTSAEGKASVMFQTHFTGDYEGAECRVYINTDVSVQGNRNAWFTAFRSVGTDESVIAQLSDGRVFDGINTGEYFDGKTAYIFFNPKDEAAGRKYDEKKFISRDTYLKGAASGATSTGAAASAPKVSLSVAAPAAAPKAAVAAAPVVAAAGVPKPVSSGALAGFMGVKQ